jgi:hypothetical protein
MPRHVDHCCSVRPWACQVKQLPSAAKPTRDPAIIAIFLNESTSMNEQDDSGGPRERDQAPDREPAGLTVLQIMGSTLAAAFGVQKRANRERDFTLGKPAQFIAAGIIFTVAFVLIVIVIVRLALYAASN